jgi:amino acid adenylation domain-containing protein/FkbM family methyltransferase
VSNLLLTDDERRRLLYDWNRTALAYPSGQTLHGLVEAQVDNDPAALAVVAADARLSYAELEARANGLAHRLIEAGVRPGHRVLLVLDRVSWTAVAVLAVLKAGATYVPLDADQGRHRVAQVIGDPGLAAVVTRGAVADAVPPTDLPVLDVDRLDLDRLDVGSGLGESPATATRPAVPVDPGAPACVVYTSGSTSQPKGVLIGHHNLTGMYAGWEHAYRLRDDVRTHAQLTNFSFVVFQADLVRALGSGGTLVICPHETVLTPHLLYELFIDEKVDYAEFVPSLLRALVRYLDESGNRLESLKLLVVGSDRWLYGEHQRLADRVGAGTRVVHSFGLTESTVDSAYFEGTEVPLAAGQLTPIGRPFPNVRLYVLDEDGEPAATGMAGELYIGGVGVSLGYLDDEELTARRFVPDPYGQPDGEPGTGRLYRTGDLARYLRDGTVQFLGRRDAQVKIRGFRVELGEVEAALREHPGVRDAVVTTVTGPDGDQLAAFVVPARHAVAATGDVRLLRLPSGVEVASINDSETFQFFQEIVSDRLYLSHGLDVRPGDVVFDVGANIGMFTYDVHTITPDVEVYAFEPSPRAYDALALTTALHGINARLFRCGLSDRDRRAALTFYPNSAGMSSFYPDAGEEKAVLGAIMRNQFQSEGDAGEDDDVAGYVDEWLASRLTGEEVGCDLRTLSTVLAEQGIERIDLLKIVVQKSEWDVLRGVRDLDWPRIGQLVLEVYDVDDRVATMRAFLEERGYQVDVAQAPLFQGSVVYLMYARRPDWRDGWTPRPTPARSIAPPPVSVKVINEYLRGRLAEYMVPTRYAFLADLPTTTTGKVDRRALPEADLVDLSRTAEYVAPRTGTERAVAEIWAEVLGLRQVGATDDFFDLGGHSLLATQVVSRVRSTLGVELSLRVFLTARTVETLAAEIDRVRTDDPGAVAAAPATSGPAAPVAGDAGPIRRVDRDQYRAHP